MTLIWVGTPRCTEDAIDLQLAIYYSPRAVTSAAHPPTIEPMPDPALARSAPTPLEAALDRVGDRWSLLLVEALLDGARRFNELSDALSGIAPNILADRLRRLERERIVVATPYQQRPPRMSYALTADGRDLASALRLLADWGARRSERPEPLHHELCGTSLETRWWCPTCSVTVGDPTVIETRSV
jgi:DNA-binding HxlR family transcriptional regulator